MFLTNLWPDRTFGTPWATRHDSGAVAYSHPCGVVFYTEGNLKLFSSKSRSVCHPKTWFQLCCQHFCYRVGQRARFGVAYHCLCCCFVSPFCLCPCMAHRNIGSNLFFCAFDLLSSLCPRFTSWPRKCCSQRQAWTEGFSSIIAHLASLGYNRQAWLDHVELQCPKSKGPRSQDVSSAIIPSRTLILTSIIFS